jgi:hypothetical protein
MYSGAGKVANLETMRADSDGTNEPVIAANISK